VQSYDFFIVNDGLDRRHSMLRTPQKRKSGVNKIPASASEANKQNGSSTSSSGDETEEDDKDDSKAEVTEITSKMSSLTLVPSTIRFGSKRLAGFAPRAKSTTNASQERN
jgi:hypothetical protein